ncbi:peptidase inhibitor family I36 protein [Peterkaempfera sp. SMS 1(5)a]|uniref:peptidase inhibitor family I36 protein n=1 Tax=Peterkaempfera podocarpi TaxID=3232308 RepID=UPI0036705626
MRTVRKTTMLAVASVAALLGAVASAGTANAATMVEPRGCSAGNFCFYNNAEYNDGPGQLSGNNANFTVFSHPSCQTHTWNDCISSVYNHGTSGLGVNVYRDANYSGAVFCVPDNVAYAYLPAAYPYTLGLIPLNDSISSNKWTTDC